MFHSLDGVFVNTKLVISIIASLLIGTGIGYAVSVLQISALQSEKSGLDSQVSKLTADYDKLNNSYNELGELYRLLDTIYRERDADYTNLTAFYNELQALHDEITELYSGAEARVAELEQMVDYEVYVLTDQEYYQSIIDDLQNADDTILVAMYSMIYDPDDSFDWANDLIRELVYADGRGVNVSVVIEYRTYWNYMDDNLEAYNYLISNNVNVQLDYETTTDHMKLVIIDDKLIYIGSHNWSESALYYNHETSVKIISETIAEAFKEYIKAAFDV